MEQNGALETDQCIHGNHVWEREYHDSVEESMDVFGDDIGKNSSLNGEG